jgi:hypothetical protein
MMGPPHYAVLKETAKANKIQLTGSHHNPCTHFIEAKIRMKNIPKKSRTIATKEGERLVIDLSCNETASFARNRYWLLILDKYTNCLVSLFLKTKDEQDQVKNRHLSYLHH